MPKAFFVFLFDKGKVVKVVSVVVSFYLSLVAKYQSTLNSFNRYLDGRCFSFDDIDSTQMLAYEAFLKKQGLCPNTTSSWRRLLLGKALHLLVRDIPDNVICRLSARKEVMADFLLSICFYD